MKTVITEESRINISVQRITIKLTLEIKGSFIYTTILEKQIITHKGENLLANSDAKICVLSAWQVLEESGMGGGKQPESLFTFQHEEGIIIGSTFTDEQTGISISCSLVYPFPILTIPRKHSLLLLKCSLNWILCLIFTWSKEKTHSSSKLPGTCLNQLKTWHTTYAHDH